PCYVWGAMRRSAALVALLAALAPLCASAVQLEALDLARTWRLRPLRFRGVSAVRRGDLRHAMSTKPRPWFAVWRARPLFDPVVFGETATTGTRDVDPAVPRRAIAYAPGQPFTHSLLDRTRRDHVGLDVFRAVRMEEGKGSDPEVTAFIQVTEAPPR